MKRIIWADSASRDLDRITDFLEETDTDLAERVVRTILDAPLRLRSFPLAHPATEIDGLRKLRTARYGYLILYAVKTDDIEIVRVHHEREDWFRL